MIDQKTKEQRVQQLAIMFAKTIKGIEDGVYDNAVLIPFSTSDIVTVTIVSDGIETTHRVNNAS